jgi:hypothetical protein
MYRCSRWPQREDLALGNEGGRSKSFVALANGRTPMTRGAGVNP